MLQFLRSYSKTEFFFICIYLFTIGAFFLYSFTQIDLGLALSRNEYLQSIVRSFQQIGYFERPLSTNYYVTLLILLYILYAVALFLAKKNKFHVRAIWTIILISSFLLTFSYTAFSHDIFNYIFDAKIVTHYQSNPYMHKALDFPQDPMLSFMHWTHRAYPYGPFWLFLTVPLSFLGFGHFLPTFILFKLLAVASYIGCLYFIQKVIKEIAPEKQSLALVFFGLNPLVLIESLVTAHIDIVMMVFAVWAFYLLLQKKYIFGISLFIISVGIKFVTGFLLPAFLFFILWQRRKIPIHWSSVFFLLVITITIGVIAETVKGGTFQPWYLIPVIVFSAFLADKYVIVIPVFIITFVSMLTYVPFLYFGNWDPPIPKQLADLYFSGYAFAFLVVSVYFFFQQILFAKRIKKKNINKHDK